MLIYAYLSIYLRIHACMSVSEHVRLCSCICVCLVNVNTRARLREHTSEAEIVGEWGRREVSRESMPPNPLANLHSGTGATFKQISPLNVIPYPQLCSTSLISVATTLYQSKVRGFSEVFLLPNLKIFICLQKNEVICNKGTQSFVWPTQDNI